MRRYAAKLLLVWNPDPITNSRSRRLCEERTLIFTSRSASDAVRKAKRLGRQCELRYDSGHRLKFAGLMQCMELGSDPNEVWWEMKRRANPDQWARRAVASHSKLYIFTDGAGSRETRTRRSAQRFSSNRA